jgi:hypothetical protein
VAADKVAREPEPVENTTALLGLAYSALGHQIVAGVVAASFPRRPAHSSVFAHIDLAGTRLTELAARANITPQAMESSSTTSSTSATSPDAPT